MKNLLIFALFLLTLTSQAAEVKISALPLVVGADIGSTDSFPLVHVSTGQTMRMRLSQLLAIPALQSPTFSGTLTANNLVGAGSGITALNASALASGTVSSAVLPTIAVTKGGSGVTLLTANGALVMNAGGTAMTSVAAGASGGVLTSNGTTWIRADAPASGISSLNGLTNPVQNFLIGTAGTAPAFSSAVATHTLNIPMANATSVTAGLVSKTEWDAFNAKQAAGNYLTGCSGDVSCSGFPSATTTITSLALSKLAALTASRLLVSSAGGVIAVSTVTATEAGYLSGVTSALQTQLSTKQATITGTTWGDLAFYNGSAWVRLGPGTSGQYLKTLGSGADPQWGTIAASGVTGPGSSTNTALVTWNGTGGATVADSNLTWASNLLKTTDDAVANSTAAADVTLQATAKTAGTGNGGNLVIRGGASSGGTAGTVQFRVGSSSNGVNIKTNGLQTTGIGSQSDVAIAIAAANTGIYNVGGSYLGFVNSGVLQMFMGQSGSQADIQLGTSAGVLYSGSANGGAIGRTVAGSLIPFNQFYMGDGVFGLGLTSGASSQYSTKALIDMRSTTKAFLPPRMTTTQKNAITSPDAGSVVVDTTLGNKLCIYNGATWETVTSL